MDDCIMIKLSDFSKFPSGRDETDGDFNGKKYRETILTPKVQEALASGKKLEVSIEGVLNFGSSFFEEAFGGLVRKGITTKNDLKRILEITPNNDRYQRYKTVIFKHIENAKVEG